MSFCIICCQGQPRLDINKGGTFHKFSKEADCGTSVNLRRVACSLKCSQKVNGWNQAVPARRLVIHLDGEILSHLMHFRCNVIITSMRFLDDMVRAVVNGLLVPLIHWYQDTWAGPTVGLLMCLWCWGAKVMVAAIVPAPPSRLEALILAGMWLTQRRRSTARRRTTRLAVRYIHRCASGSSLVVLFLGISSSALVFFLSTSSANLTNDFSVLASLKKLFSTLCLMNLATGAVKCGAAVIRTATPSINWGSVTHLCVPRIQPFRGRTLISLTHGYTHICWGHGYHFRVLACFGSSACMAT